MIGELLDVARLVVEAASAWRLAVPVVGGMAGATALLIRPDAGAADIAWSVCSVAAGVALGWRWQWHADGKRGTRGTARASRPD